MTPNERYDYGGVYEGDEHEDDGHGEGDWDIYGDNDEPVICPKCESDTTYPERQEGVRCWQDINDPAEEGIVIIAVHHYCADCDHRWMTQHGRPLNVDCECD